MNKIAIIGSSIVISMFVTGITLYSVTKYISEQDRLYTSINDPTVRHDHLNNEPVTHPTLQDSIVYNLKPIVQNIVYGILVLTAYPILYSSRFLRMLRTLRLDIIHRNIYLVVKCILIQVRLLIYILLTIIYLLRYTHIYIYIYIYFIGSCNNVNVY